MVVPYTKGLRKSFKNICGKVRIQVHFTGDSTRNLLVTQQNRDKITQKCGVIYRFKCAQADCEEVYISESARTFGKIFKEHLRVPPSTTMVSPQVIASVGKVLPGPSRRPCRSGLMIHPFIGT